jgi:hypothetical protein
LLAVSASAVLAPATEGQDRGESDDLPSDDDAQHVVRARRILVMR